MPGNANPGARQRAEAELKEDPARSNYLIAQQARCTPQRVGVYRRELEARGVIEVVPAAQRQAQARRPPRVPSSRHDPRPCRTRDAIARLGPSATPRQVANLAQVSIQAAWVMLNKVQAADSAADLASAASAAADALAQIRTRRELEKRNARRAVAGMAMLETRQPARPCQPTSYRDQGNPFPIGWPRPSEAAARLCRDYCSLSKTCPFTLAGWTPPPTPDRRLMLASNRG